jgi:hypothetical protein
MVRYLSIFPKPGAAESLLRAATSKFEKLKRECNRTVVKLGGEEHRQANTGYVYYSGFFMIRRNDIPFGYNRVNKLLPCPITCILEEFKPLVSS